jgi:hypothetical protein
MPSEPDTLISALASAEQEGDLLYGALPISRHLGLTERQVRHLHETGRMPSFKVGHIVCARRSTLNTWLAEQEAKARGGGTND